MGKMTIEDLNLKGKKVLIRVDFNVPLSKEGKIKDDRRIASACPTIEFAISQGASKVILMSHLGRPDGQVVESMRLTPVAARLSDLLKQKVLKLDDCIGPNVREQIAKSSEKVVLLENLRFYKQEEKNDPQFAKELASLADLYVDDAFGCVHRAHASVAAITKYLPSAAGFLLGKEINYLGKAVENPAKPFVVILGGAKVSDKIAIIENMLPKCNAMIIGGAMAYTFLKAQGVAVGNSKVENDKLDTAKAILAKAKSLNVTFALPDDHLISQSLEATQSAKTTHDKNIPEGWIGVDIGPETIKNFKKILSGAKTIIWNGPMGIFETEAYAKGTKEIAEYLATLKSATTIIGGGDSAAAVSQFKVEGAMTHISTGGGASLEFLEGRQLPGIVELHDKK